MNEKTLRALIEAGAVKRVRIVANGARFHVQFDTIASTAIAETGKGAPKTWASIDATARWLRALGIGTAQLDVSQWLPGQRGLSL
jgi:hypothetical protein